jgi:hypothetical protein
MLDATTARVTVPVDVWFDGRREHVVELVFGGRRIEKVTLDAQGRFPDRVPADNSWSAESGVGGAGIGRSRSTPP